MRKYSDVTQETPRAADTKPPSDSELDSVRAFELAIRTLGEFRARLWNLVEQPGLEEQEAAE